VKGPKNLAASIRKRLLNGAHARGEEFNFTLSRYAIEGFLRRVVATGLGQRFVLKGASLFVLWSGTPHRATWDLDLLGRERATVLEIVELFRKVCGTAAEPDGLAFDPASILAEEIREDTEYGGVRVRMRAELGEAEVALQVDVGFGDVIVPAPQIQFYPALLGGQTIPILAYPREAALAEKLEALVALGMRNSRMKDYYDLQHMGKHLQFAGHQLVESIAHTFRHRGTPIPEGAPIGLTQEFAEAPERAAQWRAFVRRGRLPAGLDLPSLIASLRGFLLLPLSAVKEGALFERSWSPGGPWR